MDQPGASDAAPDKTLQVRIGHDGMEGSLLVPVKGFPLQVHADVLFAASPSRREILLFPSKLRTGESDEIPCAENILEP